MYRYSLYTYLYTALCTSLCSALYTFLCLLYNADPFIEGIDIYSYYDNPPPHWSTPTVQGL